MKSIISIYKVPFKDNNQNEVFCSYFNINWLEVKENTEKEFLDFFNNFISEYGKRFNLDIPNDLPYGSDKELEYLREIQLKDGSLTFDYFYYEGEDYKLPTLDYFSKDYFIFELKEINKNNAIYEEADSLSGGKKLVLVKGETIVNRISSILLLISEAIKNKTIDNKFKLFLAYEDLVGKLIQSNSNTINNKLMLNNELIKFIFQINMPEKPGLISKIGKYLTNNNFVLTSLKGTSNLFEYVIFVDNLPKELEKYIIKIINMLNKQTEMNDIISWITKFGLETCKNC